MFRKLWRRVFPLRFYAACISHVDVQELQGSVRLIEDGHLSFYPSYMGAFHFGGCYRTGIFIKRAACGNYMQWYRSVSSDPLLPSSVEMIPSNHPLVQKSIFGGEQ